MAEDEKVIVQPTRVEKLKESLDGLSGIRPPQPTSTDAQKETATSGDIENK